MPIRNEPFKYKDNFSESDLENLPEDLHIRGERDSELLLIIRLLSGAIDIEYSAREKTVKQRKNYFVSDLKDYKKRWGSKFPLLLGENVTSRDLASFVRANKFRNRDFYKGVLAELSHFCFYEKSKSHTTAFVYLYRLLENISYCFPLIYVSKTNDFKRSYSFLRALMAGNKDKGELGFFRTFVDKLYESDPIKETSIDLQIAIDDESLQKSIFSSLKNICEDRIISENTEEPRQLSIKYCDMGGFLITVRNRFFHYLNDRSQNLEGRNIFDSDLMFSFVNDQGMQWIATVFLGITSYNLSEFQRNISAENQEILVSSE
jgi:hypothetical protein